MKTKLSHWSLSLLVSCLHEIMHDADYLIVMDENDGDIFHLKGTELLHRQIIDLIEASGTEGTTITVSTTFAKMDIMFTSFWSGSLSGVVWV